MIYSELLIKIHINCIKKKLWQVLTKSDLKRLRNNKYKNWKILFVTFSAAWEFQVDDSQCEGCTLKNVSMKVTVGSPNYLVVGWHAS